MPRRAQAQLSCATYSLHKTRRWLITSTGARVLPAPTPRHLESFGEIRTAGARPIQRLIRKEDDDSEPISSARERDRPIQPIAARGRPYPRAPAAGNATSIRPPHSGAFGRRE